MAEVVLNELERGAGVEEMRGDRVTQRMGREVPRQPGMLTSTHEAQLDLPTSKGPASAGKERRLEFARGASEVATHEHGGAREEHLLTPSAALQPPHQDPAALEIDVAATQKQHLPDPEAVVIHQGEERTVAEAPHRREEAADLVLSQVARDLLVGMGKDGQGGARENRPFVCARNSRKAQSTRGRAPQGRQRGCLVARERS